MWRLEIILRSKINFYDQIVTVFDESILVYLDVKSDLDWILEEWDLLLSMYPISKTDEGTL